MATPKQLFLEVEREEDDDEEEHAGLLRSNKASTKKRGSHDNGNPPATSSTTIPTTTTTTNSKSTALMWLALMVVLLLASNHLKKTVEDVEIKHSSSASSSSTTDADDSISFSSPIAANMPTGPPVPAPPGFNIPPPYYSASYIPRGKTLDDAQRQRVTEQYGEWTLATRSNAIPSDFPNNDVPLNSFPKGSWQVDAEYLKQFLPAAIRFAETALEAILDEYGRGKRDLPHVTFEERSHLFHFTIRPERAQGNGGEAAQYTLDLIRQRLLHAIMTESEFRLVMGGHSAAAGHGNIFQQSYTHQVQKVMEPFLARLGVYFQAHNFGMGGLGTSQNALGARDLYGRSDILMWDSGMTEPDGQSQDLFFRHGLLLHQPIVWGSPPTVAAQYGSDEIQGGWIDIAVQSNLPLTDSLEEIENVPFWARYMNCSEALKDECKKFRYNSTCWAPFPEHDDGNGTMIPTIQPPQAQKPMAGGQAGWHPGNREHALRGRTIAFVLIQQTLHALKEWYDAPNYTLADEAWHITSHMERVKARVLAVKDTMCGKIGLVPPRICNIPLYARSEMTPRRDPERTSLRSIMKEGCKIPEPQPNLYDPPEPYIKELYHPDIDIVHILQNGIDFPVNRARQAAVMERRSWQPKRHPITSGLPPGQGWYLNTKSNPSTCDGTWDTFCGKSASDCVMFGHNDLRGGLLFDGLSGWMMFHLEDVKHGLIIVRIEDWFTPGSNPVTKDWQCVNNDCANEPPAEPSVPGTRQRRLDRCSDWRFEFAIDGNITSWDDPTFLAKGKRIQRVVPLWLLLDNEAWGNTRDVELAIRIVGCGGRDAPLHLSHIYWA